MIPRTGHSTSALRQEISALLRLAIPLALAQVAQIGFGVIATRELGRIDAGTLAGGSLGNMIFSTTLTVVNGLLASVGILVAQAHGAGDLDRARAIGRDGLVLALSASALGMVLLSTLGQVLRAFRQPIEVVLGAVGYVDALRWALPAAAVFTLLRNIASGVARPRVVTFATAIGVLVLLGLGVIDHARSHPWMHDASSVGVIVAIAQTMPFVVAASAFRVIGPLRAASPPLNGRGAGRHVRSLLRLGLPIAVAFGLEAGLFTAVGFLAARFGASSLAAHQIVVQTCYVTFMIPSGIGHAATVRVARAVGAHDGAGTRRAGVIALAAGGAFMCLTSIVFLVAPRAIIGCYVDVGRPENAELVRVGVQMFRIAALFQLADGIQGVASGALRGLGDTRGPMILGVVCYWGIGLGSAAVLAFATNRGIAGVWWGLLAGLTAASTLCTARFFRLAGAGASRDPATPA